LHLLGSCEVIADRKTGELSVRAPTQVSALGLLWVEPSLSGEFERRLAESGDFQGEEGRVIPRDPVLRRLPDGWRTERRWRRPSSLKSGARDRSHGNEFNW
jgi:hypothetical protein